MSKETRLIIGVIVLIAVIALFFIGLEAAANDHVDHSDHVGPRGGHWHYNSAGHKTYYKPR